MATTHGGIAAENPLYKSGNNCVYLRNNSPVTLSRDVSPSLLNCSAVGIKKIYPSRQW